MEQPRQDEITLNAGDLRLTLSPSKGGAISRLDYSGDGGMAPVLRGCDRVLENVLDAGNFPLVPFVNRISGGSFNFRGRRILLRPNMAGDPSPLHGQGWQSEWRVAERSHDRAELTFDHAAGEWPWDYRATQSFRLDESGLELRLTCVNRSSEPMPCGLGQHPYFPCTPATRLRTGVTEVWTIDENVLPIERVAATGRFDLRDVAVCGLDLDHGFGGWSGEAEMSDPAWPFTLRLSSPDAHFFQLYSPAAGGLFVAEPVSHANDALSRPEKEWAELGLRILQLGEEMSLTMRLDLC